jgi:hypothetical protein
MIQAIQHTPPSNPVNDEFYQTINHQDVRKLSSSFTGSIINFPPYTSFTYHSFEVRIGRGVSRKAHAAPTMRNSGEPTSH